MVLALDYQLTSLHRSRQRKPLKKHNVAESRRGNTTVTLTTFGNEIAVSEVEAVVEAAEATMITTDVRPETRGHLPPDDGVYLAALRPTVR